DRLADPRGGRQREPASRDHVGDYIRRVIPVTYPSGGSSNRDRLAAAISYRLSNGNIGSGNNGNGTITGDHTIDSIHRIDGEIIYIGEIEVAPAAGHICRKFVNIVRVGHGDRGTR